MTAFLFSSDGRIGRGKFWSAILYYVAASMIVGLLLFMLWQIIPGEVSEEGSYNVTGAKSVPYLILIFGYIAFCIWSGICIGVKRYHDRNKSGWWLLIQLVPLIGATWYFIEAGCLRGTAGPNRFGPDPLGAPATAA
jgi:uncharacterized membrane protein YhaH (DUF805 family)